MSAARLPPDVLYEIFKTLSVRDPINFLSPYGWIRQTTHVCRAWRNVALGQTELWADNVCAFGSPIVTDLFIARARSTPLVFECTRIATLNEHQLELAIQYINQTRALIHPVAYEPLSAVFDGRTLPHLEVLHVAGMHLSSAPSMSSLHTLSLRFCCFPIHAPQLRSLSLKLRECQEIPRVVALVLDILGQAPLLEELRLSDLPRTSQSELANQRRVNLAHLCELRISSKFFDSTFFQKLILPGNLELGINVYKEDAYNDDEIEDETINVPDIFAAVSGQLSAEAFDSLCVTEDYHRDDYCGAHLIVELWSSGMRGFAPLFYLDARMSIHTEDDIEIEPILEALFPHLNLERLTHIDLTGLTDLTLRDRAAARRILAPLTCVESAVLDYGGSQLELLLPHDYKDGEDEAQGESNASVPVDRIFPALRDLTLTNCPCPCECEHIRHFYRLEKAWPFLTDFLRKRQQSAHPIRTLTLVGPILAIHSANSSGWEEGHELWIERARQYTKAVVIGTSARVDDADSDRDARFDWHIEGPE